MKKIYLLTSLLLSMLTSCTKDLQDSEDEFTENSISTFEDLGETAGQSSTSTNGSSSRVLTATMKSDRTLKKGKTFSFTLTVKKGNDAVSNYPVSIDDPIRGMCIEEFTNSKGIIELKSKIPSYAEPDFYQFRFYIKNAKPIVSTVAVYDENPGKKFASVKVDLKSELQNNVSLKTMTYSERAATIGQFFSTELINSSFGQDLYKETFNNPASNIIMGVTAISCPLTLVFPPAGGVCVASASLTTSHLTVSTVKVLAKRAIDNSDLSSSTKIKLKILVDATSVLHSIATFKIDKSLKLLTATNGVAIGWDYKNVVVDVYRNPDGSFKGFNLTGEIKSGSNKGEMCVITAVKK